MQSETKPDSRKGFIWRYIAAVDKPWIQALFIPAFFFFFAWAGQSWQMGVAYLIHVICHEYGHWLVFTLNSIKSKVLLLFPLGAVAAPISSEENIKSDNMPHRAVAWLAHSGLLVNLAIMAFGKFVLGDENTMGHALVQAGGILAIMNLLPLSNLDAAIMWKAIFASNDEQEDRILAGGSYS